jgi:hypothetical protein
MSLMVQIQLSDVTDSVYSSTEVLLTVHSQSKKCHWQCREKPRGVIGNAESSSEMSFFVSGESSLEVSFTVQGQVHRFN